MMATSAPPSVHPEGTEHMGNAAMFMLSKTRVIVDR